MACEICDIAIIGDVYTLRSGPCDACGHRTDGKVRGSYMGMRGSKHIFRLHPNVECLNCGRTLRYATYNCQGFGLDVTSEFQSLIKGGSNAKR